MKHSVKNNIYLVLLLIALLLTACQNKIGLENNVISKKILTEKLSEVDYEDNFGYKSVHLNYNDKITNSLLVNNKNLNETLERCSMDNALAEEKLKWLENLWENIQKKNDKLVFSIGESWLQFDKEAEWIYYDGEHVAKKPFNDKEQQLRVCKGYDKAYNRAVIVIAWGNFAQIEYLTGEGNIYSFSKTVYEGGYITEENKYSGNFEEGYAQGIGKYEATNNYFNIPGISGNDYQFFEGYWKEGNPVEGVSGEVYNRRGGLEISANTCKGKFEGDRFNYQFMEGEYEYTYINEDPNYQIIHSTTMCDVIGGICKNWKVQSDIGTGTDGLKEGSSTYYWPRIHIQEWLVNDRVNIGL